jgi:hypothetical protein
MFRTIFLGFYSVCASPSSCLRFLVNTPECSCIPEVLALVTPTAAPGERDVVGSIYLSEVCKSIFNGVPSSDGLGDGFGVALGVVCVAFALGDCFGVVCVDCVDKVLFCSCILACSIIPPNLACVSAILFL